MGLKTKNSKKSSFELIDKPLIIIQLTTFFKKYYLFIFIILAFIIFSYLLWPLFKSSPGIKTMKEEKQYTILSYNKILYKGKAIKNPMILNGINAYETGYLEKAKLSFTTSLTQRLSAIEKKASLVNLANLSDDLSQYDLALKYLDQAKEIDKKDGIIFHNLGIVYKHKRDYKKSIQAFQLATKYNPHFVKSYLSLASLYFYLNDIKKALQYYKEAEDLSPANSEIKYNIAICFLKQDNFKEAEASLTKIISSETMSDLIKAASAKSLGTYYAVKKNYEKALFYYTQSLLFKQEYDIYDKIGTIYKILGKYQEALDSYSKAYQLNEKNIMTIRNLAELYYRFGEEDKSLKYYQYLVSTFKAEAELYMNMAEIYYQKGDIDNAILYYKKSLEVSPTPDEAKIAHANLGNLYFELKDYISALNEYQKALEFDPSDVTIYYNMSLIYLKNREMDNALQNINKVMKLNPDNLRIRLLKANVLRLSGKNDDAIIEYEKIIEQFPKEIIPYFELGNFYYQNNRLDKAEHYFKLSLDLQPEKDYVYKIYLNLAIIYLKKNNNVLALDFVNKAEALNAKDGFVSYNYGLILFQNQEYEKALNYFFQVMRLNSEDPIKAFSAVCIGNIYFLQGKFSLAESMYEKALQINPGLTEAYYNAKRVREKLQ